MRVRTAVRRLPAATPPAAVTAALRVLASRERTRRLAYRHPVGYYGERLRLAINNFMRPLALPFAGGLISALILFSMLMPTMRVPAAARLNDIPVPFIYTDPAVKTQTSFGISENDFVLDVVVDGEGRAVDYSVREGGAPNAEARRNLENNLLFTRFTPATAYGRPIVGKMSLGFSRYKIDVPSKS